SFAANSQRVVLSWPRTSRTRARLNFSPLFAIMADLSQQRVDFSHHRRGARDVLRERLEKALLEFATLHVAPMRFRLLPFRGEILGRLHEDLFDAAGAHR